MPAKLICDEYKYYDIIYNDTAECGVDAEYYLPDYCPDIQKILRCCTTPQVETVTVSGDKVNITGNLGVTVLYCDEKAASIKSCEFSKEFSFAVRLPQNSCNGLAEVTPRCGHTVCRAVNARKLDVHVPVLLDCTVFSMFSELYTKDVEGAEKLAETFNASKMVMSSGRDFNLNFDFELAESAPPIESLFRKEVSVSNLIYAIDNDFVTLRGEVDFNICYRSYDEDSIFEKMRYKAPFSEQISCDGLAPEENLRLCVSVSPSSYSVQLKEDSDGEYTKISLYLKMSASVRVYCETEFSIVKDCYTTDCIGKESYSKFSLRKYESFKESAEFVRTVTLENCERILDIWTSDISIASFSDTGKLNYRGGVTINVLYVGTDKRLNSAVKAIDFTFSAEQADAFQRKAAVKAAVNLLDFRLLSGSEAEIKLRVGMAAFITAKIPVEQLSNEEYISELPEHICGRLVVCYDAGCSIWELGKKHRISIDAIRNINGICGDAECGYPLILFR